MLAIKNIEVDGNDGSGKTFRINLIKQMFPGIVIKDRGIFSEFTLNEKFLKNMTEQFKEFRNEILKHQDTLYILFKCSVNKCQERIAARGDSLEEEFHTKHDLQKYEYRFNTLYNSVKDLPNVIQLNSDEDIYNK